MGPAKWPQRALKQRRHCQSWTPTQLDSFAQFNMTKTQAISPDSTCHCATLERASKPQSAATSVRLTSTCDTDLNTCTVFSLPHLAHKYAPSPLSQVLEIFCVYMKAAHFQKAACHPPLLCRVIFTVLRFFFCCFLLSFCKHRFPARFCVCFQTKEAAFPAAQISSTVYQKYHIHPIQQRETAGKRQIFIYMEFKPVYSWCYCFTFLPAHM